MIDCKAEIALSTAEIIYFYLALVGQSWINALDMLEEAVYLPELTLLFIVNTSVGRADAQLD